VLVSRPPAGQGWRHEVKHDGFRMLALKDGARVRLWSRRGTDYTDRLTRIAEAVRGLPAERALVDGEVVVFRSDGRSDFEALLTRRGGESASYVAFDLLTLNGEGLRPRPIEERRAALSRLVARLDGVLFSEAIGAEGELVFAKACEMGLEGIVCVFKTHPKVYQYALDALDLEASAISFQSSNAWDAHGASAFGMRVVWCNRYGQRRERLPGSPDFEIRTLAELPALLRRGTS
jgi:bifunctional non-homologous end joining protein LigD